MIATILVCALGALGLAVWFARGPFAVFHRELIGGLEALSGVLRGGHDARILDLEVQVRDLTDAIDRLPSKWEDVKRETTSLYQRSRHHVRRAQEELEARGLRDPELDDLASHLHGLDGSGGSEQGVLAMSTDVGPSHVPAPPTTDPLEALIASKFGAA